MSNKRIAILGSGVAGLHLGLFLRRHDVEVTLFTERAPEDYAHARLLNTATHHAATLRREQQLGVDHWGGWEYRHHRYCLDGAGERTCRFEGSLASPSRLIDHRVYLPRLMTDFLARGGRIESVAIGPRDLEGPAFSKFDLLAVCSGRGPLGQLFDVVPELSPFNRPQRLIAAGLFVGVSEDRVKGAGFCLNPGVGEIIECTPTLTFGGAATTIVFEAIPGKGLEALVKMKYEDDPKAYLRTTLALLRRFDPVLAERIDERRFDLANGPRDLLQGAITPTVRKSHVTLASGRIALAVGDVQVLVDPVMAQGANISSHSAWIVGEEIVASERLDQAFVERVQRRRMRRSLAASAWTNYMLTSMRAPPGELSDLFRAMSQERALADRFTANFDHPERQWRHLSSPARLRAWARGGASRMATCADLTG